MATNGTVAVYNNHTTIAPVGTVTSMSMTDVGLSFTVTPRVRPWYEPVTTPRPKTAREALEHAALIINEHEWGRGSFYDYNEDSYCIMGALFTTLGEDPGAPISAILTESVGAMTAVLKNRHELTRTRWERVRGKNKIPTQLHIPLWNDYVCRGKADAIALLREAALLA